MPRRIDATLQEICDLWIEAAVKNYRQQLSMIDASVAQSLGISIGTVRNYRKQEEGRYLGFIFEQRALHLLVRKHKRVRYRRLADVPEELIEAFRRSLDRGIPPTVAYTEIAASATAMGFYLPSLRTFLRRVKRTH
jgi:hypothetical protein